MPKWDKFRTWAFAVFICCNCPMAFAQDDDVCKQISQAVSVGNGVEGKLLTDPKAVPCLADEIGKIGSSVGLLDRTAAAKMISATGALRVIMTRGVSSPTAQQISPELRGFVEAFRGVADKNLNVVSALSFGARDDNPDLRLNSVLIAGNIIDDNTVCVPLTQLNDKALAATSIGVRGRANLLSVVNVVAPWASKQNFETMSATTAKIALAISRDDPNFSSTVALLDNIKKRLDSQTAETNKKYPMGEEQLNLCRKYIADVKSKLSLDEENLRY